MIQYYVIKHKRDTHRYLSTVRSGWYFCGEPMFKYCSVYSIYDATRFSCLNDAEDCLKLSNYNEDFRVVKIILSEDIDINPTEEEYALWKGGCRLEAYIAYRQRTGLGVLDIIPIFKVVFDCDDFTLQNLLKMIKSAETTR